MASSTMSGPLTVTSGITITGSGLTVTAGGLTVTAGGLTITDGDLTFGQAISQVVPGATSLSFRNNADGADNLLISDAGLLTTRIGMVIGGDADVTGNVAATTGFEFLAAGGGKISMQKVSITAAEIRALATTQIDVVTAPAAGRFLIFLGALVQLDWVTPDHGSDTNGNLTINYTNASGVVVGALEAASFIGASADQTRWMTPSDDVAGAANIPKTPVAAAALVMDNDGSNFDGSGNGTLDVTTYFMDLDGQF